MIRIDFTDSDNKYAGSVYTPEGDWTEESLNRYLMECVELRRRDGKEATPVVDYLCRFAGFYPKTSTVFHFQISDARVDISHPCGMIKGETNANRPPNI